MNDNREPPICTQLDELKQEIGALRVAPRARLRHERLKGLRIRARTFLDEHRRSLPHDDAIALRRGLEQIDRLIASTTATRV
jgi:hypothetical protein